MKYLSKILNLNWLRSEESRSKIAETPEEDPRESDISMAKFEDDGSLYLMALDWQVDEVQEWVDMGDFMKTWDREISESSLVITSGKIGDGGDIQVVKTSLDEVFESDE
jgi:hypothetical protein